MRTWKERANTSRNQLKQRLLMIISFAVPHFVGPDIHEHHIVAISVTPKRESSKQQQIYFMGITVQDKNNELSWRKRRRARTLYHSFEHVRVNTRPAGTAGSSAYHFDPQTLRAVSVPILLFVRVFWC